MTRTLNSLVGGFSLLPRRERQDNGEWSQNNDKKLSLSSDFSLQFLCSKTHFDFCVRASPLNHLQWASSAFSIRESLKIFGGREEPSLNGAEQKFISAYHSSRKALQKEGYRLIWSSNTLFYLSSDRQERLVTRCWTDSLEVASSSLPGLI